MLNNGKNTMITDADVDKIITEADGKFKKDKRLLSIYLGVFIVLFIISALATIILAFIADGGTGIIAIFTTGITAVISIMAIVILLGVARNVSRSANNSDIMVALMLEERKERLEKNVNIDKQ